MLLRNLRLIFFLLLFLLLQLPTVGSAQTTDTSFVVIKRLVIAGNQITKPQVIIREMMIKEGDTIDVSLLEKVLSRSKDNLMNLGIFNFVDIKTAMDPGVGLALLVNVSERWYIIPIPQFELVDRNFNEWVRSGDLGRVNYGLNLDWTNFRGMNETIKLQFKWGYTRKIGLSYQLELLYPLALFFLL